MHIHDTHGHRYSVTFGSELLLDGHLVSHTLRTHNSLILHGFTIPHEVRRRKVGSVLLHALERHYELKGVTHVTINQREDFDEAAQNFLEKNGYHVDGKKANKILVDRRF
jgi:ribosomal protein S18 acetylase RimI-like enzyme